MLPTLILNNLFNEKNWKISIIGNSNGNYGLDNHNIDFIERMSPVELENKILNYHTGLVLRDSSIINKVAAPCKISDYLCLGMPIIYSGEIGSINDFIMKFPECGKYILNINDISSPDKVNQHINISKSELEDLSMKAQSYFGVKSVIDKYIIHFNS